MTEEEYARWEGEGGGPPLGEHRTVELSEEELAQLVVALDAYDQKTVRLWNRGDISGSNAVKVRQQTFNLMNKLERVRQRG